MSDCVNKSTILNLKTAKLLIVLFAIKDPETSEKQRVASAQVWESQRVKDVHTQTATHFQFKAENHHFNITNTQSKHDI